MSGFLCKDFVETRDGLIFAVVCPGEEEQRVLACLRYQRTATGCKKLSTSEANELLAEHWPEYLYYSKGRDVKLHGVPRERIVRHHQPRQRLLAIWQGRSSDRLKQKLCLLVELLRAHGLNIRDIGVTGSLLIGAQNRDSDIDLVFYRRETFYKARELIRHLPAEGVLHALDEALWHDTYERRGCSLSFDEFHWHERRKHNKAAILQTKFDISLLAGEWETQPAPCRKQGKVYLKARIKDARHSFDYPARYLLEHPDIREVLSYTASYVGQANQGETVEVIGQLEISAEGQRRVVVGTDREAAGEYLRVLPPKPPQTAHGPGTPGRSEP